MYENEILLLKKEINELKIQPVQTNKESFKEKALLNQIDDLRNDNKILNDSVCNLKKTNDSSQARVRTNKPIFIDFLISFVLLDKSFAKV